MNANTKKLAVMAMFTAIAAALITLVHFPLFPAAAFLQYDPADVPILICAFAYGPAAGLAVTLIASFIQAFFLGGDGIYGFLMHVIATGTLTLTASLLYRRKHTRVGAVAGLNRSERPEDREKADGLRNVLTALMEMREEWRHANRT